MTEGSTTTAPDEARRMLEIFARVDARAVDVTWTTEAGEKRGFRRRMPLGELAPMLPGILDLPDIACGCTAGQPSHGNR